MCVCVLTSLVQITTAIHVESCIGIQTPFTPDIPGTFSRTFPTREKFSPESFFNKPRGVRTFLQTFPREFRRPVLPNGSWASQPITRTEFTRRSFSVAAPHTWNSLQWRHWGGRGKQTAPGDTLQGVTPEEKNFVGKFTKNSGETRSDR